MNSDAGAPENEPIHRITYSPGSDGRYYAYEYWWDRATKKALKEFREDLPSLAQEEYNSWLDHRDASLEKTRAAHADSQAQLRRVLARGDATRSEIKASERHERVFALLAHKAEELAALAKVKAIAVDAQASSDDNLAAARAELLGAREVLRAERALRLKAIRIEEEQARQAQAEAVARIEEHRAGVKAARQAGQKAVADIRVALRNAREIERAELTLRVDILEPQFSQWTNWLLSAGRSQETVKGYSHDVSLLARRYPTFTATDYKTTDLNRYQAERRTAGLGASIRKRGAAAFRSFFKFVSGTDSPAKGLPYPKVMITQQRDLTWEQTAAVLAACDPATALGLRDLAMICLMIESGIRSAEVCRLELANLDLQSRRFRVIVKGGREGVRSFDQTTGTYLDAWIEAREKIARPDTKTLFCSLGGLYPGTPLTRGGLHYTFNRIAKIAGLANGFSPHDLRRSCATLKTRMGAPSRVVQVGGGWSSLKMVERYTQSIGLEEFELFSPVSRLMASTIAEQTAQRQREEFDGQ